MAYDEENDVFEYTDQFDNPKLDSPVDEFYYDKNSKELLIILDSGYGWVYHNVLENVFNEFVNASSKGRYYSTVIKPFYGPGTEAGWDPETEELVPETVTFATGGFVTPVESTFGPVLVDLAPPTNSTNYTPELVVRPHRIDFTVEGGNATKSYNVDAVGVIEATDALLEVGKALDLEFRIKGVYVSFE